MLALAIHVGIDLSLVPDDVDEEDEEEGREREAAGS